MGKVKETAAARLERINAEIAALNKELALRAGYTVRQAARVVAYKAHQGEESWCLYYPGGGRCGHPMRHEAWAWNKAPKYASDVNATLHLCEQLKFDWSRTFESDEGEERFVVRVASIFQEEGLEGGAAIEEGSGVDFALAFARCLLLALDGKSAEAD